MQEIARLLKSIKMCPLPYIPPKAEVPKSPFAEALFSAFPTTTVVPTGQPKNQFPRFSSLPPELRSKIWKMAVEDFKPALVRLLPRKIPVVFDSCSEARRECGYVFLANMTNNREYCLFINPVKDVLSLNIHSFPESLTGFGITTLSPLATAIWKCPTFLIPVKRLLLTLDDVRSLLEHSAIGQFHQRFKNLTHLMILLRPGPAGARLKDLYSVERAPNNRLQESLDYVQTGINLAKSQGLLESILVKFFRSENWEA